VEEAAPDSESIELEEISSVGEDIVEEPAEREGNQGEINQNNSDAPEDGTVMMIEHDEDSPGNSDIELARDENEPVGENIVEEPAEREGNQGEINHNNSDAPEDGTVMMIEHDEDSPGNSDIELASDENEPFYYEVGSVRCGINHHYETIQSLHEATIKDISLSDEDDDNIVPSIPIRVASRSSPNSSNNVELEPDFSPENTTVDLEPTYTLPIDSIVTTDINRTVGSNLAETNNHTIDESERNIDLNAVQIIHNSPSVSSSNPSRTPSGTLMFVSDVFGRLTTFSKLRFFKRQTNLENISDATLSNLPDTETVFVDIGHSDDE
jgi:hypothetical protein